MDPVADMFKKTDDTAEMPPVSLTMADVSVRLSALEDTVAQLKKLITQPDAPTAALLSEKPLEYTNVFPVKNVKKGGRRTTKRKEKKNRKTK